MVRDEALDEGAQADLLRFARATLEALCAGEELPSIASLGAWAERPGAVFVTLEHRDGSLRGCMGTVRAIESLADSVREMTVAAARRDPRFPPVRLDEVPDLRLSISVMHEPKPLESVDAVEIGRDGLIVERRGARGLLLPQVATKLGWDRVTFLEQTCIKAGLPPNCWRDPETQIEVFASDVYREGTRR